MEAGSKMMIKKLFAVLLFSFLLFPALFAQDKEEKASASAEISDEDLKMYLHENIRLSDDHKSIFWNLQSTSTVPKTDDSGSGEFSLDFSNLDIADLANIQIIDSINTIILTMKTAEKADLLKVLEMINALDQPKKQVLIRVTVAEMEVMKHRGHHNRIWSIGEELSGENGIGTQLEVNHDNNTDSLAAENQPGYKLFLINGQNLEMFLSAQKSNQRFNVLSKPQVVARHGEKATVMVGRKINVVSSETQVSGQTDQIVQYSDQSLGLEFSVTPFIYADNKIGMDINHKLTEIVSIDSDLKHTETSRREITTFANVKSGNTIVLAGMFQRRNNKSVESIPGLNKVPLLGNLFNRVTRDSRDVELLLFITPTILPDGQTLQDFASAEKSELAQTIAGKSKITRKAKGKR